MEDIDGGLHPAVDGQSLDDEDDDDELIMCTHHRHVYSHLYMTTCPNTHIDL